MLSNWNSDSALHVSTQNPDAPSRADNTELALTVRGRLECAREQIAFIQPVRRSAYLRQRLRDRFVAGANERRGGGECP